MKHMLTLTFLTALLLAPQAVPSTFVNGHSPHIPDLIERPKWTLAA